MSDGPNVYQDEQGTWCYRLSAWGSCIRSLVAARRGITAMPETGEPPAYLREGHLHEADVIGQLQASGYTVEDRQQEVVLEVGSGRIVGHLDAGGIFKSPVDNLVHRNRVLEVKAPGKAVFKEVEAMGVAEWVKHHPIYSWQVSGAMWSTQKQATVVVKSRDSGKMMTADIDIPFKTFEEFEARMAEIDKWVEVDRFPPCEKDGFCWKGEYRHIHYKEDAPRDPIPIHETRNNAIETLTEKLYDVRQKKRAILQQEEDVKDELLGLAGVGVYVTDHHKVTIRETKSTRMDQKAVREEHGDRYDIEVSYPTVRIDQRS